MKKYLLLIILIMAMSEMVNGQIRYVTPTGAGLQNGVDWLNAYDSTLLQYAVDEVADSSYTEVWVAAGTYTPGDTTTAHFSMRSGVAIYGGFAGTESSLEERDWMTNVTILSGEIGNPDLNTDNIHSVFYNSEIDNTALLDGFTIQDGYNGIGLGGAGGAMFNFASSPIIRNCTLTGNTASFGAGMFNSTSSSPTLINCIITKNFSRRGAGIYSNASTPTLINCKVTHNTSSINGGGVESTNISSTTLINCTVAANSTATFGGGIYSNEASTTTIQNSIIWGNKATLGGSQVWVESGTVTLDYSVYAEGTNNVGTNTGGTYTATNSIVLDPQFVTAEGTEFLIAGSSPAVDAGLDTYNNQENDLRGNGFGRKLNKVDGSTGTIDMGAYEFNVAHDPAGGIPYSWTGATNTDWNIAGNWDPATVPGNSDRVTIPGGVNNYPVINSAIEIYHLTIATEASFTISISGQMTVTNAVINNGTLTIQSNTNGTGSLIASDSNGTGTTTLQSYLLPHIWNLVSSPVSGQTIGDFLTAPLNVTTIETNGTSRGMRDYNPETDTWNSPFTNSTEGSLGGGKGFAIKLQGSTDAPVTYNGSLQAGPVTVTTVIDRWNLVGNPYTSAIGMNDQAGSAENFLTHNSSSLDPIYGAYVWDQPDDGNNQATGQFRAISNVPNPSFSSAEVKPGQTFLVKMKPTVSAVSFNKQMQIHPTDQAPADEPWPTIQLKATINGQESSTIIAFNSEMTHGLDPTYDVGLYKGEADLAVYTRLVEDNGHSFAIQALPETRYDTLTIPVGIDVAEGGDVIFSAETFNIPANYKPMLEDRSNNTFNNLSEGSYTVTIDANTTNIDRFRIRISEFSGATLTWTGATNTDWNTSANWEPATVPDNLDGASIPGGLTNYPVVSGTATCYDLNIETDASLLIAPKGAMTVKSTITNNGTLTIQSDAESTGSLITGTETGSGTTTVERFLTANTWNMVSSPLSGQTIAGFLTDPVNVTNVETNGTSRGMMDFNPQTDSWNNFFTNTTSGSLRGGKGFSIRLQGDTDAPVVFTGSPQTGAITVSTVMDSWNSVGNPYTSAIRMTVDAGSVGNFLTHNAANLDPVYGVYVWDHEEGNNQTSGQYRAISNVPSHTYANVFLPGQAFLVKMRATATTVSFTETMQTHPTDLKPVELPWPTIQLIVSAGGQQSSTIVAFNDEMTHGLDTTYDAGLLKRDAELELYTRMIEDNGFSFAIQALPESGNDTLNIPVGIESNMGGEVIFSAETFNLPETSMAVLVDQQTNTTTNLSESTYTATIEPNTSSFDRFLLRTSFLVGMNNKTKVGLLSAYPIRNTEIRITGKVSKLAIATLYDIQGKTILIKTLEEGNLNSIRTPNLQSGIYLLSVKDNQQVQRFKIPVSQ